MDITTDSTDGTNDSLSWGAVTDADGYRITVEIDADASPAVTVPTKGRFWLIEAMGRGRSEQGLKWGKTKKSDASINVVFGSTIRATKNKAGIVPFEVTVGIGTTATVTPSQQPSQQPPAVSIVSPANGATITANNVAFYASASDDEGVQRVELYVNNGFKRSEVDAPYGWGGPDGVPNLDLTGYPDGTITFKAIAYDVTGLTAEASVSCALARTPAATAIFDGRATGMTSLTGSTYKTGDSGWTGNSDARQSPLVWGEPVSSSDPSGLYFITDSISLLTDPTYTKVYKFNVGSGDTNPYFNQPTKPNAELTKARPISMGQWDWYAAAFKIVSPYTLLSGGFNVLCQYGYPALASPPLSIAFDSGGLGIDRHVGILAAQGDLSGPDTIITKPRFWTVSSVLDKWVEMVIGVKWEVDQNGEIYVYSRIKANSETNFTLTYSDTTRPTFQRVSGQSVKTSANDKMSLYFGTSSSPPTNTIHHRGFTRWNNQTDAIASMG